MVKQGITKEIWERILVNDRICPIPQSWNELWEMLPNRQRKGNSWEPPPPLILAAWHESTDLQKKARLIEHLEWAKSQGCLDVVEQFLDGLSESQWHHSGEN